MSLRRHWVLSGEIRLLAGFASSRRLMKGFYNMALSKSRLAFMVTTETEALHGLTEKRPGLLIATEQLEQGSGLALVEQVRRIGPDIRTILIVDGPQDDRWPPAAPPPMRCCARATASGPSSRW